ncbi:MAG: cobalt-precorrin-6A reductase [Hassallia sp.]
MKRVLILGGTGDAAELAAKAANISGIELMMSLAGRTRQPKDVAGNIRIGGFGGLAGLTAYLRDEKIDLLIDATHPFAAQISLNAAASAAEVNIPALMLVRPMWERVIGDNWIEVESIEAAAAKLGDRAKRVFLTIGRQELAAFAHLRDIWFLMRMIDPPQPNTLVPKGLLLYDRGPFTLVDERQLLIQHAINTVVSKNSGGDATYAKTIAARELNIPVVMVQRPAIPEGDRVANVEEALNWLISHLK